MDAEYWGYIGEKHCWGKGFGALAVDHCLWQAASLGLARVWLTVVKKNVRAIALYKRMGFLSTTVNGESLVMETPVSNAPRNVSK